MSEPITKPMTEADLEQMARWFQGTEGYYRVARLIEEVRRVRQQVAKYAEWERLAAMGCDIITLPRRERAVPAEKPLAWTKEPPTVPGWYWWRFQENTCACVVEVSVRGNVVRYNAAGCDRTLTGRPGELWAGPLAPPV